ncbi:MAG: TolC family protein [Kiritimatiellales bacterium]|nr:TolC family protein [Kiritimatiellales bacterium]
MFAAVLMIAIGTASCTRIGNFAEKRANRAAYRIIGDTQRAALGKTMPFSIDDEESEQIGSLLGGTNHTEQAEILSLADTLAIAIANSRSYQREKESLFIQALDLTDTHKYFGLNYSASADAGTSITTYKDGHTESFGDTGLDAGLDAGARKILATGARITLGFSQNVLNYYSNPDFSTGNNALSFSVVQPLLNGFGPLVTREPLRQAERDMVYAVRDFKRYQQSFVISIASQYYGVLSSRDKLENERKNYESAVENRRQTEAYAKAGRIAEFEAAQARQRELNAADSWTVAEAAYQKALDDFRFELALPVDLNVEPDSNELLSLEKKGLVQLDIELTDAIEYAISNRLDLITRREQVEDKSRKLEIVRRNFLPNLDVSYDVSQQFDSAGAPPSDVDIDQTFGATLDLPLDWTERRNNYRVAQITLAREKRGMVEDESEVELSVRDLWRQLERTRSVYKNRLLSVELAERRVESTTMLLKLGRAVTRDVLESQDDLLASRNQATAALVDYTIRRLRFWNAIERFDIDPKGMWYEEPKEGE